MNATHRSGKSALDEFLPELDVQLDNRQVPIDPRDIQLESVSSPSTIVSVEFPAPRPETLSIRAAADKSRVQWWPMFAAALVGIGVSLLAFGTWARFGNF